MTYSSEVLADSPLAYWRLGELGLVAYSASSTFSGTPASNAFDGSTSTAWTSNGTSTGWLQVQYTSATVLTQYTLTGRRDATPNRSPKDWTFQGSNDGSSWTTLDTRTGVTNWSSQTDARTYTFSNSTAYAYYRLNVTANNGDAYLNVTELVAASTSATAADASGNARHGVYANNPTLGATGALSGDSDTAVTFTAGSSQQMSVPYWSGLNTDTFTLECWVKTTATSSAIMGRAGGTPAPYSVFVDASGKTQLVIKTNSAGTAGSNYSGAVTINDGAWHHIVVTRDGTTTTAKMYVDGTLDTTHATTDTPYALGTTQFVVSGRGGTPYLTGTVDEPAIYNTVLSAARVTAHRNAGTGTGAQTVSGGQASSTNTAQAGSLIVGKVVAGGLSVAANVALAGSLVVGSVVAGGQASESDSGRAGSVVTGTVVAGGQALESDAGLAGSVAAAAVVAGGLASEADAGLAGTVVTPPSGDVIAGGTATETNSARPGTIVYGYTVTDTSNRAGGISVGMSMPLTFEPAVDPAPARAAKRNVIRAAAFDNVTLSGSEATYDVVTKNKRKHRQRVVIGGKDATYINGAETQITWQLVSPLLYGPATATIPGIKTPFKRVGFGTLKWLRKGATVKVQLVDDADHVTDLVYKGIVQAWNIDGTDLTVQIGGEASGRAAMRRRPLPVYSQNVRVGRTAYSLIRNLGLSFKPFLGPETPDIVIPRLGGMWWNEAIERLCKMSQRRDGTQFTIMPDGDGDYRFREKDTTTVHATVYVDGTRVRANVRSDMVEEPNRVFANAVTPEGRRLTGTVTPGIVQGEPRAFGGSNLSIGDTGLAVVELVKKLHWAGFLNVGSGLEFDADVADAVKDVQDLAGLPTTGVVNEATWDALWNLNVTGFSLGWAHREPVVQQSRVRAWLITPDGSILGKNPAYDPTAPVVDTELDLGSFISAQQRRSIGRAKLHEANTDNWVGTIEVSMGAVIAGEHNPGDPLTAGDLLDFRLLKPGQNLWCPGFQSDTGTLFHITGIDVASQTLQVDTRARDTLEVADVIRRNRDERMFRNGRRASIEAKDVVGEWDGAAGGELGQDITVPGFEWTVFGVPAGDEGTISRLRVATNPNAETCMAIFGGPVQPQAIANYLNRKIPLPLTADGSELWSDRDIRNHLDSKGLLDVWGEHGSPGGYHPRSKDRGGELTGVTYDDSGYSYRTDKFPVLYVAVWSDRDTTIPAGRIMWNQLEPGA